MRDWWSVISDLQPQIEKIETQIQLMSETFKVRRFPETDKRFRFTQTELKDVKVVILGQDPYPGDGVANGLAFSVNKGQKIPASLQNIFKELKEDLGVEIPKHGDLTKWASQGVLLLNTALTVGEGIPGSDVKLWEPVTGAIIKELTQLERPVIFMLWGQKAQDMFDKYAEDNGLCEVLRTSHPSPLSVREGFSGCRHFSLANRVLQHYGVEPIDWSLD